MLLSETDVPPDGAGWLRVTVQVVEAFGASVRRVQLSELSCTTLPRESKAVWELPFRLAVRVAV